MILMYLFYSILRTAIAFPFNGIVSIIFPERTCDDLYLIRNHESRIKAETELAYQCCSLLVFKVIHELLGSAEGNLCYIFLHFISSHPYTFVTDCKSLFFLISRNGDCGITGFTFEVTCQ